MHAASYSVSSRQPWPDRAGAIKTAAELFGKIEAFLALSTLLELSASEERALVAMDAKAWASWRCLAVPPHTPAPPFLVRRIDYALHLLRRMASGQNDFSSRSM